jgi:amino acid adenylation domain-containing protein
MAEKLSILCKDKINPDFLSKNKLITILKVWNKTQHEYQKNLTIPKAFQNLVENAPNNVAVTFEDKSLTYDELNKRANKIANYLLKIGIEKEQAIAVCMDRSLEIIIGILGILKTGGAYLPVAPDYPNERLAFILKDSCAKVILTQDKLKNKLINIANNKSIKIFALDSNEFLDKIDNVSQCNPNIDIVPSNLAYIIYTSGSTGDPKGVLIEHRSVVNLAFVQIEKFNITANTKTLNYAPFVFDSFIWELLTIFFIGGILVVTSEKDILPGKNLLNTLQKYNITFLTLPPSSLRIMKDADLPSLKTLVSASEQCSLELIGYWANKVCFYNGYGPTECSVCTTIHLCSTKDKKVTIGKPINNIQVYILDEHLNVCPIGVTGELFIGGEGLARGYLNLPELNKIKFIKNPLISKYKDMLNIENFSERLYRTGDLARWLPNGDIECLGRIDNQVKIRGFRIELDEINQQLNQQSNVIQGVAVVKKDRFGNSYLSAYIQLKDKTNFNLEQFRSSLNEFLPDYMVPDAFVILDNFPTTFSGKIDVKQLLNLESAKINSTESSTNEIEIRIKKVLEQLFGIDLIELDSKRSFFDIGLHSFMLLQLCNNLNLHFNTNLTPTDLFVYPNIGAIANLIKKNISKDNNFAKENFSCDLTNDKNTNNNTNEHIAIIAMDGKFPGSDNLNEFWQNLINGKESISDFTSEELMKNGVCNNLFTNSNYVRRRGVLKDIELFDSYFFEQSPNESALTDPQHRIFLEISSNALEKAGYNPDKFEGKIGVFAGCLDSSYQTKVLNNYPEFLNSFDMYQIGVANSGMYLSTKVSYKLNLTGPSLNINSACSTSLVTVIEACEQLNRHTCDLALAGGVSISLPQKEGYLYEKEGILSEDGHCRAFSNNATGTVASNGAGVIVLKRLSDALKDRDHIEAVIIGYSVNNDAYDRNGFTAPSAKGQANCIYEALKKADINPEDIKYIETHGTGTKIGDPIEIRALTEAFRAFTSKTQFCGIGSLKTNIGHTYCAAGIAGLIKAALVVKNHQIPPTLHFKEANSNIDLSSSPFYVNNKLISYKNKKLENSIASVSSFGFGGTNAHLILKEYKEKPKEKTIARRIKIITISSKTADAIDIIAKNLSKFFIENKPDISDVAFTLNTGRREFNHRRVFIGENCDEFIDSCKNNKLANFTKETKNNYYCNIAFMFPGQGSQYPNMALGLYKNEPFFKDIVTKCFDLLKLEYNIDLLPIVFPFDKNTEDADNKLENTLYSQTALFVIEYALAKLFINWGVKPQALIGHSFGEYVAACISESITLEHALFLIVNRAKILQKLPPGAMLSINLKEEEIAKILPNSLSIATINAPSLCVISGDKEALDNFIVKVLQAYSDRELNVKFLKTSKAFHSKSIDLIMDEYSDILQKVSFISPKIPIFSTSLGKEVCNEITDKKYWLEQMRHAVCFSDSIKALDDKKLTTFIEIGPGNSLSSLTKLNLTDDKNRAPILIINSLIEPKLDNEHEHFTAKTTYLSLAKLWLNGVNINWNKFYQNELNNRIELPTYPFDKQYCWPDKKYKKKPDVQKSENDICFDTIENTTADISEIKFKDGIKACDDSSSIELFLIKLFEEILGIKDTAGHSDFFDLGGDSLSAAKLISKISRRFSVKIELIDIYANPTIKNLTDFILDAFNLPKKTNQLSSLITIKKDGDKSPLIFIHPIGGAVFCYLPLIKLLEKLPHPIYCIQDPFIDGSENIEFKNIHEVVSFYIKKIESIDINQPYNLIGSSYGGSIAWEMAKRLTDNNKKVLRVILLDSWAMLSENHRDFDTFNKVMQKHNETLNLYLKDQKMFISEKKSLIDLQWQRMQLLLNHVPSTMSSAQAQDINIISFKAKDRLDEYMCIDDPKNHWQKYCQNIITSYLVDGDHESILKEPNVKYIAENLIKLLS